MQDITSVSKCECDCHNRGGYSYCVPCQDNHKDLWGASIPQPEPAIKTAADAIRTRAEADYEKPIFKPSQPEKECKEKYCGIQAKHSHPVSTPPHNEWEEEFDTLTRELWGTQKKAVQDVDDDIKAFISKLLEGAREEGIKIGKRYGYAAGCSEESTRQSEYQEQFFHAHKEDLKEAEQRGYEKRKLKEVGMKHDHEDMEERAATKAREEERQRIKSLIEKQSISQDEAHNGYGLGWNESIKTILTLLSNE